MRTTTETMSIRQFMNRDYHMDALGAVLGIVFMLSLPAYYCMKFVYPAAVIAYKTIPIAILL